MQVLQTLIRVTCSVLFLVTFLPISPVYPQEPAWLERVNTEEEFYLISMEESGSSDRAYATNFLAPVRSATNGLPLVYPNVKKYRMHIDFMKNEFPQYFADLTSDEYLNLVYYRANRTYYAGTIYQFYSRNGTLVYGFNLFHSPQETVTLEEATELHARLAETFGLRPLAYAPLSPSDIEAAKQWKNPPIPMYLDGGLTGPEYEAYSIRTNYGRIRLHTLETLDNALKQGQVDWQDIVVVDQAPADIETVVTGILTGTRQGELSHINIRAQRRGTPNAYVQNATQALSRYQDQLVKLILTQNGYQIIPNVTLTEAETWWDEHRPSIPPLPQPDEETDEFLKINRIRGVAGLPDLIRTYGGEAGQLTTAYTFLDPVFQEKGFAIPFSYYQEFMQANRIASPTDASAQVTYEEYLALLMAEERFRGDSAYRRQRLEDFVEYAREHGQVSPDAVDKILAEVTSVFGSSSSLVEFRPSSNTENSLTFTGVRLYESTTVCPDDNLDSDDTGPSRCDPNIAEERTIEQGLKTVWTSLWSPKAYDEREYYRIDHSQIRMGVLVTQSFPDKDANGVAFSGNLVRGEKYNIEVYVQRGDVSVIQSGVDVLPEKDWVSIYSGGGFVQRLRKSTLLQENQWILTEEQLIELGTVVQQIDQQMPLMDSRYMRKDVIMDVEFVWDEGKFLIQLIRPAVSHLAQPIDDLPDIKLIIPENTKLAGVFQDGRSIQNEYEMHSMLYLKPGEYVLPTTVSEQELDLVDFIEYTTEKTILSPTTTGKMTLDISDWGEGTKMTQFIYTQKFTLPDQRVLDFTLGNLRILSVTDTQEFPDFVLTEDYISQEHVYASLIPADGDYEGAVTFASSTYKTLQLYKHTLELADGSQVELYRRHQIPFAGSGPANLVYALVNYQGQMIRQGDYWKLVYAAVHHNWDEQYRVVFDAPVGEAHGLDVDTFTFDNKEPQVFLLNQDLKRYQEIEVENYTVEEVDDLPGTRVEHWMSF